MVTKNFFFWLVAVLLLTAGIIANSYFANVVIALRLSGWIALACVEVFLIAKTTQGRNLWNFAKDARGELRKVVWPTRQETMQITMIVAASVLVMSILMWGIDSVLFWVFGFLTG